MRNEAEDDDDEGAGPGRPPPRATLGGYVFVAAVLMMVGYVAFCAGLVP